MDRSRGASSSSGRDTRASQRREGTQSSGQRQSSQRRNWLFCGAVDAIDPRGSLDVASTSESRGERSQKPSDEERKIKAIEVALYIVDTLAKSAESYLKNNIVNKMKEMEYGREVKFQLRRDYIIQSDERLGLEEDFKRTLTLDIHYSKERQREILKSCINADINTINERSRQGPVRKKLELDDDNDKILEANEEDINKAINSIKVEIEQKKNAQREKFIIEIVDEIAKKMYIAMEKLDHKTETKEEWIDQEISRLNMVENYINAKIKSGTLPENVTRHIMPSLGKIYAEQKAALWGPDLESETEMQMGSEGYVTDLDM